MKDNNFNFRTLKADEIECRVGTVSDGKGVSLLMYKNARVDMQLLDEVVGAENWRRSHEVVNGNLFCTVSIRTDNGEWCQNKMSALKATRRKRKDRRLMLLSVRALIGA